MVMYNDEYIGIFSLEVTNHAYSIEPVKFWQK